MSKDKKERDRDQQNSKREFKIPDECKKLVKLTYKKFKKDSEDYYDSKKELKKAYFAQIVDMLPASIALVVKFGHYDDVKDTKMEIYNKISNPDFVKYLTKEIKNDCEFDNMMLLPNLIYDIVLNAQKEIEREKNENPDAKVEIDMTDLVEMSRMILKKKIKKMTKAGVDEALAFDALSVIPTGEILKKSQYFHIRQLFQVLYEHAKTKDVNFEKIIKIILKGNEDYINSIITFALLERKEKITNFNDGQKKLFNDITEYCFKTMEEMDKSDIQSILKAYVDARKRDEAQNKDTNRRYYISSLPESDYPKILKTVTKMCENNEDLKKYF